jgi:3-deoxy-D-manno-octulosonate 8-phosphate phosphatase (KDO 8-P phosphatase)
MKNYKEKLKDITTFIFDVDGVLTDGNVIIYNGEFIRSLNAKDTYAIQYACKLNYSVFIITGGFSQDLINKLIAIGVKEVYAKSSNKLKIYEELKEKHDVRDEEVLYIGDDIPDYHVMTKVNIATCPQDAVKEIKDISDYHSPFYGGKGCVRDVIEQTLKIQNNWMRKEAFEW